MSPMRSRTRSRLTRDSTRATGSADAGMDAAPERHVLADVRLVDVEGVGIVEALGIAVGGSWQHHHHRPGLELGRVKCGGLRQ